MLIITQFHFTFATRIKQVQIGFTKLCEVGILSLNHKNQPYVRNTEMQFILYYFLDLLFLFILKMHLFLLVMVGWLCFF